MNTNHEHAMSRAAQPLRGVFKTAYWLMRRVAGALATVGLCHTPPSAAHDAFTPSSAFTQLGSTHGARTFTIGVTWDLPYHWVFAGGNLSSYVEASYSNWQIRSVERAGISQLSQIALVPVLRYRPDEGRSSWFLEGGLGLSATSSIYRTRDKAFSTILNFGTHLAVGRSFGERKKHEIALRIQHFSNAGIKHPNPGENFVQVRYAYNF